MDYRTEFLYPLHPSVSGWCRPGRLFHPPDPAAPRRGLSPSARSGVVTTSVVRERWGSGGGTRPSELLPSSEGAPLVSHCARPTRAYIQVSPTRPRGDVTPRFTNGRAFREHRRPIGAPFIFDL